MDDERRPDHTEDPRGHDTGQGYPEASPPSSNPDESNGATPEDGAGGADAPEQATERERDRSQSTGNPHSG